MLPPDQEAAGSQGPRRVVAGQGVAAQGPQTRVTTVPPVTGRGGGGGLGLPPDPRGGIHLVCGRETRGIPFSSPNPARSGHGIGTTGVGRAPAQPPAPSPPGNRGIRGGPSPAPQLGRKAEGAGRAPERGWRPRRPLRDPPGPAHPPPAAASPGPAARRQQRRQQQRARRHLASPPAHVTAQSPPPLKGAAGETLKGTAALQDDLGG